MRPMQKVETFPDGVVDVYAPGSGRRVGTKRLDDGLHYERQSVGIRRFYESGMLQGNQIDKVIKVPHTSIVNRLDIVVDRSDDNRQYRITRIQNKPERNVDIWELQSVQVTIQEADDG